ncbi:MAG: BCCT family transporter [Thalassolituus sp.]|jgi:choline/glycine/proline betaine transport protein|uniref:High-affinity choline uptake protein BetT n=1 Tax=hydrothermal vent metagenome TaxID=652676 RepID=A0A160TD78_9ZZZZ|nr:BCCT family transporter [Thalassolituus oleivorans]AHK16566.1 beta-aspartyl peptidase [Thalassolituus oleivorans R6-15]APR68004.1 choline transporter [Thalassolituus oleivorans]MCA6126718.1 choline transporter [Thalassolituus oleivorans 4BN06-13]
MTNSQRTITGAVLLPVFVPAVVITLLLILGTLSNPELAGEVFKSALAWVTETFGWFYMLATAVFLVFIICVGFSSWGNIRLGPDHAEPQYSFPAWFAMLFSAGYGIALLFFGVAEPVLHFSQPPNATAETVQAAREAMQIAYFHWGLHIWGIYGLMGLVLAYFAFRHGLPLSVRSALYPLIGDRIYGPIGHAVDVFAILGTLFGLATTLGLSVTQINAGLHYLWEDIPISTTVQITAIALITVAAIGSVVAGMDKGVKNLSILNMVLAVFLMGIVFLVGPSIHILDAFVQNTGAYLGNIVSRTFNLQAYTQSDWIGNWTLFIFAWTIAWAPFVGLFIAKISRGRTIRQFVFGVLVVPTTFTFLWFAIFGDTALYLIMEQGKQVLIGEVQADHAVALFEFYDLLPWSTFLSVITVFLIITFFVTSSDSGSLVVDSLASGGAHETPIWQRVFWASLEGVIASTLLLAGGLSALQTMSILAALPFAIIMLLAALGLWRALVIEGHRGATLVAAAAPVRAFSNETSWRKRLSALFKFPEQAKIEHFIKEVVTPAMEEVQKELAIHDWKANITAEDNGVTFQLERDEKLDFFYQVLATEHQVPDVHTDGTTLATHWQADVYIRNGALGYELYGCSRDEVIRDLIDQLEQYFNFVDAAPGHLPWNTVS